MALEYTDPVNGDGLFDILGQLFGAFETLSTVRQTTVQTQVAQFVAQYKKKTDATLSFDRSVQAAATAEQAWRLAGDSLAAALSADAVGLLQEVVLADSQLVRINLTEALEYLIAQMLADAVFVAPSTVTTGPIAPAAGNSATDLVIKLGLTDHLGRSIQTAIPESLRLDCTAGGTTPGSATLRVTGERSTRHKLAEDWPTGSGVARTSSPLVPDTLLANGGFEEVSAADANIAADWLVGVGTPGTTLDLTGFEVQTLTVAATPTSGTYHLQFTHPVTGVVRSTPAIAWDAGGPAVQTALRTIQGLEDVTVETTGTSPDFTHTITFTGLAGNLAILAVVNNLDTGTITPAQVTAGEDLAVTGRALRMRAHASQLTAVYHEVALEPDRVYFLGYWITPSALADGFVEVGLVQSIGGAILTDRQGNAIKDTVDLITITQRTGRGFFFALPPTATQPVYVTIRKTAAEDVADLAFDNVVLVEGTELYAGGPYLALLAGQKPPQTGDLWTIPVSNNLDGKWQRFFDQFFDLAGKRLVLPTSGTTEISEALIG